MHNSAQLRNMLLALVSATLATSACYRSAAAPATRPAWVGLSVSKETTLLTEPLRPDGTVDYVKYINDKFGAGVTPENNALLALLPATGKKNNQWDMQDHTYDEAIKLAGGSPVEGCYVEWETHVIGPPLLKIREQYQNAPTAPWNPAECPEINEWIDANTKALDIIREATKRPHFWVPLVSKDGTLTACPVGGTDVFQPSIREQVNALLVRAMRSINAKDYLNAWEDISAAWRMGELLCQDYNIVSVIAGILIENQTIPSTVTLLEKAAYNKELLAKIMSDVNAMSPPPSKFEALHRREIFTIPSAVASMATETRKKWEGIGTPKERSQVESVLNGFALWLPDWDRIARKDNEFFADYYAEPVAENAIEYNKIWAHKRAMEKNVTEESKKDGGFGNDLMNSAVNNDFLVPRKGESRDDYSDRLARRLLYITIPIIGDDGLRVTKKLEMLKMACALQLFHAESGTYPEKLDAAARKYQIETPSDFWGKPLGYSHLPDGGFRLESLGPDETTREDAIKDDTLLVIEIHGR